MKETKTIKQKKKNKNKGKQEVVMDKGFLTQFHKDLVSVIRASEQVDKFYAKSSPEVDMYSEKLVELAVHFNDKYKHLVLKVFQNIEHIKIRLLLNEDSLKKTFEEVASKLPGLQGISTKGFSVSPNPEKELENAKRELYISYVTPESGPANVYLKFDDKEKKVEIIYDPESIVHEATPEFLIAAEYGAKEYDKKIKVDTEAMTLGFADLLSSVEKRKYFEKFDPHFGE